MTDPEKEKRFNDVCHALSPITAQGLGDNWSQVRFSASRAVRAYYGYSQKFKNLEDLEAKYNPELIPRMCLNRYYVAEGVRNFSIDTWRIVCGEKGKDLVCDLA